MASANGKSSVEAKDSFEAILALVRQAALVQCTASSNGKSSIEGKDAFKAIPALVRQAAVVQSMASANKKSSVEAIRVRVRVRLG